MLTVRFNVTGPERKKLAQVIGNTIGQKPRYLPRPVNGYSIGSFQLTSNGVLECENGDLQLENVIAAAEAAGFSGNLEITEPVEKPYLGSISVSKEGMTPAKVENLQKIIIGKAALIRQAFDVDTLPVIEEEDRITFHWFKGMNPENAPAFCEFAAALVKMAREAKRVTMTEKPVENPKYAWRCFLLRLGMIGPEYKETRKILMKNFSGSSAFKTGKDAKNEHAQSGNHCSA